MIEFSAVTFGYGLRKNVLHDFSLTVASGERLCLSGASGCGKTTVARLLLGLEKPRRGAVTGTEDLRFSAVFQEDRLLPWKTVLENAAMFSTEEAAQAMLCRLGLDDALNVLPGELSGGMKRRAALARALSHPFDVLVLDESLTGLDNATKARCLSVIDEAVDTRTLVLITHDAAEAAVLRARVIPMGL